MLAKAQYWHYIDPRIGSVGVGRTFPGPCMPFGMVKPGPDCGVLPNAGWAPMPEPVSGFSQTHVSGTGGGQKYGNILIQPLLDIRESDGMTGYGQLRKEETIELGYYSTTYENGIRTEITTSERCAHYRIHYPTHAIASGHEPGLFVDVTHFLGKDSIPNLRERQQYVGSGFQLVSDHEVKGYSSISGGWNNGDPYTVFFCLTTDKPFTARGSMLSFADTLVQVKIGISYISEQQAHSNIDTHGFDEQLSALRHTWDQQLRKIQVSGSEQQKRMFYTALYHTMLMPVCKTGENPRWTDAPYYDDYYAIWDTYRTSSPLLTLLCPEREVELVNALLNIYKHDGYLPDARSGDCNGRTQGGSNAEVVIADAFVKGLPDIDYELALEAMLKDGETDPGADHEKHGRGGLMEYKQLGYIPYGIPRAGNRTVEYAFNDYCLAQVARGLGRDSIYEAYMKRSGNWRNLWRADYQWDDMYGFIMPRDVQGQWLDSVPWGRSRVFHPQIPYTPVTKVAPWYLPWWDTFFYEATSEEYSLSVPHDIPGLIEACGGAEAFRRRLDLFFAKGYYNVQNEPSFLTPCLYHWIGRPDLSSQRIHQIIVDSYSDRPDGLPGNDDSGAMSSWLAFHMMGLYPNAGHDYYLLSMPLLSEYTMYLNNGRELHVRKQGVGDAFGSVSFNGLVLKDARITHHQLMEGGELVYHAVSSQHLLPKEWATSPKTVQHASISDLENGSGGVVSYTLNRQFRHWQLRYQWQGDTLSLLLKQTLYRIPRSEVEHAKGFCWQHPQHDGTKYNNVRGTMLFISSDAKSHLLQHGWFVYDDIVWREVEPGHVRADIDGTEMWLQEVDGLCFVNEMRGNPLGIDWKIKHDEKD
ncbi:MAG: GH92 family glycosyl hydrolase [Prevotella sp.]|nr:GH92 family glycosyl hydrolase [Prevotella sp.]